MSRRGGFDGVQCFSHLKRTHIGDREADQCQLVWVPEIKTDRFLRVIVVTRLQNNFTLLLLLFFCVCVCVRVCYPVCVRVCVSMFFFGVCDCENCGRVHWWLDVWQGNSKSGTALPTTSIGAALKEVEGCAQLTIDCMILWKISSYQPEKLGLLIGPWSITMFLINDNISFFIEEILQQIYETCKMCETDLSLEKHGKLHFYFLKATQRQSERQN